jgi:hypothetical protein
MMSTMFLKLAVAAVLVSAASSVPIPGVAAQKPAAETQQPAADEGPAVEEFTAFAVNINSRPTGPNRPTTAQLTIRIERWSTDAERETLLGIVNENSKDTRRMNDAFLQALQRMPRVGRIREGSSLGWDLRYARQASTDGGGRQVFLATDRPIPLWEARNQPRTFDYRFTFLEMRLDKDNRGEGKMLADTRLLVDRRTNDLVLEHYDTQPVRLNQIRRRN